jgi:hypothetical protein
MYLCIKRKYEIYSVPVIRNVHIRYSYLVSTGDDNRLFMNSEQNLNYFKISIKMGLDRSLRKLRHQKLYNLNSEVGLNNIDQFGSDLTEKHIKQQ